MWLHPLNFILFNPSWPVPHSKYFILNPFDQSDKKKSIVGPFIGKCGQNSDLYCFTYQAVLSLQRTSIPTISSMTVTLFVMTPYSTCKHMSKVSKKDDILENIYEGTKPSELNDEIQWPLLQRERWACNRDSSN